MICMMRGPYPGISARARTTSRVVALLGVACLALGGCDRPTARPSVEAPRVTPTSETTGNTTTGATAQPLVAPPPPGPMRVVPTGRIVAIGDVHGDLSALREALRAAGVIDAEDHWSGGTTTLVQTGDVLDRGDDEQAIMDLFERISGEAKAAGGLVVWLLGNHEIMNVRGDLRYVTPGGFKDFVDAPGVRVDDPKLARFPEAARARLSAFLPGGAYALKLSGLRVVAMVGETVFVHGGVLPPHVTYGLDRLNAETSAWMRGAGASPELLHLPDSPVWTRVYSAPGKEPACAVLDEALAAMGAKRMVVGHSVQPQGITSACEGKVWRIDVGMAKHYGGRPAALEIQGDAVRAINAPASP